MEDLRDKIALQAMSKLLDKLLNCGATPEEFSYIGKQSYKIADNMLNARGNNDNGWIEWNGGECPLVTGSRVDVMLRNGSIYRNQQVWRNEDYDRDDFKVEHNSQANSAFWKNDKMHNDIIKYKIA